MRKIEREYQHLCDALGADLKQIEYRNGHYALHLRCGVVFASGTPSDRRNHHHLAAKIRRLDRK